MNSYKLLSRDFTGTVKDVLLSKYEGGYWFARITGDDGKRYTLPDFNYPEDLCLYPGMRVMFSLYDTGKYVNVDDVRLIA